MAGGGGAWKVAYADFVTAMMALFMVLWISAQDKKILVATSRYFQSPFSSPFSEHAGVMPNNKDSNQDSTTSKKKEENPAAEQAKSSNLQLSFLNSVAAEVYRMLRLDQDIDEKPIDVQVTSDGLRITLFDRARRPLFENNSTEFTEWGRFIMQNLAWLIERHHFRVTIDGHTRSQLELPREDYSPWELSTDRANAARRSLVHYAVGPEQIERVTGYSDTRPIAGEKPEAESNQRITLSLSLLKGRDDGKNNATAARPSLPARQTPPNLGSAGQTGVSPIPSDAAVSSSSHPTTP
ncbi:MAG TPA: flagellar motor protein MotB [Candidatus Didemnitutus sp.]|nr:flagellar motor protein MotB [Candidatus Didemnitutus sp.]